jgi:hypothetical protein
MAGSRCTAIGDRLFPGKKSGGFLPATGKKNEEKVSIFFPASVALTPKTAILPFGSGTGVQAKNRSFP